MGLYADEIASRVHDAIQDEEDASEVTIRVVGQMLNDAMSFFRAGISDVEITAHYEEHPHIVEMYVHKELARYGGRRHHRKQKEVSVEDSEFLEAQLGDKGFEDHAVEAIDIRDAIERVFPACAPEDQVVLMWKYRDYFLGVLDTAAFARTIGATTPALYQRMSRATHWLRKQLQSDRGQPSPTVRPWRRGRPRRKTTLRRGSDNGTTGDAHTNRAN